MEKLKRKMRARRRTRRARNGFDVTSAKSKIGRLIIVGGREDKTGEMKILKTVVEHSGNSALVVATVASEVPLELWKDYCAAFKNLGVKDVRHLHIQHQEDARSAAAIEILENAECVYFTGGDQLKITTKIGGTPVADRIFEIYRKGGTIAGTSAGASVMGETMLIGGEDQESHKVGNWLMAPGLGLVANMIIDQHFAQRGRIGRLLGAVALNPGIMGVGIDENTAIYVQGSDLQVIGENAVYVVDGHDISFANISEAAADKTMSMHNVRLHVLSEGDHLDLINRHPKAPATLS